MATEIISQPKSRSISKKIFLWIAIGVLVVAAGVYLTIGAVAANTLTMPDRVFDSSLSPANYQMAYENITFPSKDGAAKIAGWYIPGGDQSRAVILVHGRNASRTDLFLGGGLKLAKAIHDAGLSVMMIDLRGHGQSSDGRFTFGLKERKDVIGAVDWLIGKGYQPGKIGTMGISLGSAAAIGAAADDARIGALVSDSGFSEIYPMIQRRWEVESGLPLFLMPSARFMIRLLYGYDIVTSKPDQEIGKVSPRPILLIHCLTDELIPYSNVTQLNAAVPSAQLWTIPTCQHGQSYNADPQAYQEHLISFFDKNLQ
jgi:uncharacterized protein